MYREDYLLVEGMLRVYISRACFITFATEGPKAQNSSLDSVIPLVFYLCGQNKLARSTVTV